MGADPEAFTLLSLGLIIIGIRVYARWSWVGPANFQLDDYLMPLTGVSRSVLLFSTKERLSVCSCLGLT